jgi:hypothetical protein
VTAARQNCFDCLFPCLRSQWYGSSHDEVVDMMVLDARHGIENGTIVSMKSAAGADGFASMRCTSQHGCLMET